MGCILNSSLSTGSYLNASTTDPYLESYFIQFHQHPSFYCGALNLQCAISESLVGTKNVNLQVPIGLTASLQASYENPRKLQGELCFWTGSLINYAPFGTI